MRQLAGTLNRGWLIAIGLVLLLAGLAGVLATTGLLSQLLTAASTGQGGPTAGTPVLNPAAAGLLASTMGAVAVALLGAILGLLGLGWLQAQIPRTNAARPFRLHDDAVEGLTICGAGVLAAAVEADVRTFAGVNDASAVIRGTASAPELTIRVSVDDCTDLRDLLRALHQQAAANLSTALDVPLAHLAVQLDIDRGQRASNEVIL